MTVPEPDEFDRLLGRTAQPAAEPATGVCLDADTLAAFADGALSRAERAAIEAHVADCSRCLDMVAAMARTEPPAAGPSRTTWVPIRWLVPLTTAALALVVFVLVRDPRVSVPPAVEQAFSTPAPPPSSAPLLPSEISKPTVPDFNARDQRTGALSKSEARQESTAAANTATVAQEPAREADTLARRQAAPLAPVPPLPPLAAAPPAAAAAAETRTDALQQRVTSAPTVITSPDPQRQWRFSGSRIEATRDGGVTWQPQNAPATADLLAGASPAANVCWLVGRSGVVLLTTDGETWQRLTFPDDTNDLVSVAATDARSALVTTGSGRTYRTLDGGRSWTLQESPAAPF